MKTKQRNSVDFLARCSDHQAYINVARKVQGVIYKHNCSDQKCHLA